MSAGVRSPVKTGAAALSARSAAHQLSATTATHVARGEMANARRALHGFSREARAACRPGAPCAPMRTASPEAARPRRSAGFRSLFAGPSSLGSGWPTKPSLVPWPERRIVWRRCVGRLFGQLAEGEGPRAADHEAVGRVAFRGANVPAVGRGADEHRARDGGRLAQRLFERAYRCRRRR